MTPRHGVRLCRLLPKAGDSAEEKGLRLEQRGDKKQATAGVWESEYRRRTPVSKALYERALAVMPGGDTRTVTYFPPYPVFIKQGKGCHITDVDGNEYLDLVNNYTSLIHGHAHSEVISATEIQLTKGSCFAAPIEVQVELAQLLSSRIPSLQQVRFCNSGTEATLAAIRAAKAFTGRNKILKIEGGYHGSHDSVEISVDPPLDEAGPPKNPIPRAECAGLFRGVLADVLVAPFNDAEGARQIISRHSHDLAAIIVEPLLGHGGTLPAEPQFLQILRTASQECGALLIFDEIISFRLSYGGAQEIYSIRPDLTTLGKIIGGGLPVGAVGGRADVMALFDPRRRQLSHSGTFNGNALTMTAGLATLRCWTREEIARLNHLGELLRQELKNSFLNLGIPAKVTGMGSLAAWHFTDSEIVNYRNVAGAFRSLNHPVHLSLMNRGIFTTPRGSVCLSTPMQKRDIDEMVGAFQESLREVVCTAQPVPE
jgi:glutamate-1-semialdehyde 2,1-aminomutase